MPPHEVHAQDMTSQATRKASYPGIQVHTRQQRADPDIPSSTVPNKQEGTKARGVASVGEESPLSLGLKSGWCSETGPQLQQA